MRIVFLTLTLIVLFVPHGSAQVAASHNVTIVVPRTTTSADSLFASERISANLAFIYSNVEPGKVVASRLTARHEGYQAGLTSDGPVHLASVPDLYPVLGRPIEGYGAGLSAAVETSVLVTVTD